MMDLSRQRIVNRAYVGDEGVSLLTLTRWLLLVAATVVLLLTSTSIRTEIRDLQYGIEELQRENRALSERNEWLRAQYQALASPARLAAAARELGLVAPDEQGVVVLQTTASSLQVPGGASPDNVAVGNRKE
ncbi:MAG: hypothetical protein Kow00109_01940 [Acidobacteriota bacterium]